MPTIDIDLAEFEKLLGVTFCGNMEKLDALLAFVKAEVKAQDKTQGIASIECKDTNRPDLWSAEGLARGLRCYLNLERGIRKYALGDSVVEVQVDAQLYNIRPFICCSIIKDVHLSDAIIRGIMHLQDKLDKTYGRNRQKTSIGIYNFDLIKPPIKYKAVKPKETSFIPLGFTERLNLNEILEQHPKGIEYGHIVKKHPLYPMLFDSEGKVLSFPPIINSNDLGKITEESRNLLVEVTGTLHQTVLNTLNLVTAALIDHGGKAYGAKISYPARSDYSVPTVATPNFGNNHVSLSLENTNNLLGLNLSSKQICELLQTAGLGVASANEKTVEVLFPFYRVDIMHAVDLIEDVAVAYGYNNIEPRWRELPTTGKARPEQRLLNTARELIVGLGYQEISTYTLTNPETLFTKMNIDPANPAFSERCRIVEILNPKIVTMTCLRNWLLPNTMEFLSNNQSVEFPQKVFELGKVTLPDETRETRVRDEDWLAAASSHISANFSEIKSALEAFFMNLGIRWQIQATSHPSFIEGRAGTVIVGNVDVGVVGELNPQVLEAWKLENPTAAFEINLQKILEIKQTQKHQ